MTTAPLRPLSLGDLATRRLLGDVIAGRYAPGQRLSIEELAGDLGISRTPVREAVLRLAGWGFVDVARNARTNVALWGVEDMRERIRILASVATLGIQAATPADGLLLGGLPDHGSTDLRFLAVCERLLERHLPRSALFIAEYTAEPLRLYLRRADVAQVVTHAPSYSQRDVLLERAEEDLAAGQRLSAAAALDAYAVQLARALGSTVPERPASTSKRSSEPHT